VGGGEGALSHDRTATDATCERIEHLCRKSANCARNSTRTHFRCNEPSDGRRTSTSAIIHRVHRSFGIRLPGKTSELTCPAVRSVICELSLLKTVNHGARARQHYVETP
jgi:hypothetical protein